MFVLKNLIGESKINYRTVFDLIISNPPYLSHDEWDQAEPEVKMYDPRNALVAQKQWTL